MSDHCVVSLSPQSAAPHSCPHPVRLEALRRAPLLEDLPDEELTAVEKRVEAPGYEAAEQIYRAGDHAAGSLFLVASGAVRLARPSSRGESVVVSVLGPGESFGTLTRLDHHAETAEAIVDSCVVTFPIRVVRDLMERYPQVALAAFDEMAERLEQSYRALEQLSVGGVDRRIAAALLHLADKLGRPQAKGAALSIPLSRADLAAMAQTTPETVSRVLGRLREKAAVDFGRGWTSIIDSSLLQSIANS